MALDDATLKRIAAIQAAANHIAGLNGTVEDVIVTADIFLQYIDGATSVSPAQTIADKAYRTFDKEEFGALWREAARASLMTHPITLGAMTGPLGDYLQHRADELKNTPAA